MINRDHKAPRSVVFSSPLLPLPLYAQIISTASCFKHSHRTFLLKYERPIFSLIQNNGQNYNSVLTKSYKNFCLSIYREKFRPLALGSSVASWHRGVYYGYRYICLYCLNFCCVIDWNRSVFLYLHKGRQSVTLFHLYRSSSSSFCNVVRVFVPGRRPIEKATQSSTHTSWKTVTI